MDKAEKEILITVMDEGVISFGQRVYVLDKTDCKIYTEKCPICDDAKKISVKGMEFDCPYCRGYRTERQATQFAIYDYAPYEYIINKIEIIGEENRSAYSKDGCIVGNRYPMAKYSGFTKFGNSLNSIRTRSFSRYDFREHSPNVPLLGRSIGGEYCFLLKADAKAFSKRIHERQKEMLDRFNTEHGTNHEYPFEY